MSRKRVRAKFLAIKREYLLSKPDGGYAEDWRRFVAKDRRDNPDEWDDLAIAL